MLSFDRTGSVFLIKFIALFACAVFVTKTGSDFVFTLSGQSNNIISAGAANVPVRDENRLAMASVVLSAPDQVIKLGFVGDIMLDRRVKESIIKNGEGDYRFPFWRAVNILQKYDILFGNLEGPISAGGEDQGSVYSFRMDPRSAEAVKFAGFDVVSLANNHIGDWGGEAIGDTVNHLDKEEITHVGAGPNPYSPKIISISDTKLAFLAFTNVGAKRGDIAFISKNDKVILQNEIEKAKASADIVIVYFHFGEEYQVEPGADEVELAHKAIDMGADIVVGSHPHIIEKIEKYKNKYIAYSLGNFVFDQDFAPLTMQGMLLEARVENKAITGVTGKTVKINQYFQAEIEE